MRTVYCFTMNGAGIKTHDTERAALRQARQWKATHLDRKCMVEEMTYSWDTGYVRTYRDIVVELPMLVPELTPRADWDDPEGR